MESFLADPKWDPDGLLSMAFAACLRIDAPVGWRSVLAESWDKLVLGCGDLALLAWTARWVVGGSAVDGAQLTVV